MDIRRSNSHNLYIESSRKESLDLETPQGDPLQLAEVMSED